MYFYVVINILFNKNVNKKTPVGVVGVVGVKTTFRLPLTPS